MKKLFEYANQYLKESDWKDLVLIKSCLCAMGIILGLMVPKEKKKYIFIAAAWTFLITYIPLMAKFFIIVRKTLCHEVNE